LIVVSAPSGAGKSTLCAKLRADHPAMVYSISCTTRKPRGHEVDGREYHFLDTVEFARRVAAGDFLEHATVHGNQYGTLRQNVVDALSAGHDVLMDIDVQGAASLRRAARAADGLLRRSYVDIFITPPSLDVLRQRLEARREDSVETVAKRLRNARDELARCREFQYLVVNDDLAAAYAELRAIVAAEHCRIVA
jgi:guanylate kinase